MRIREFINSIEGLSPNTRSAYEQTLWQINNIIKGKEPTKDEIYAFLSRYNASSLHRHRAAIKAYREFTNPGEAWPFSHRQFSANRPEIMRYVPVDIVNQMIEAAEDEDERMYVLTLFTLGCRINELMKIEPGDITTAGVKVLAKGNKYLLKVITKDFYPKILEYSKKKPGRLFPETYSY